MPADIELLRRHLHAYDFSGLLVEELGWNHYDARSVSVQVNGFDYVLEPAAEKAGFAVYICGPDQDGAVPPYPIRRKIERQVDRVAFEHMIVFVDAGQTIQVWQWVKREGGKPAACHEQDFREGQRGDSLLQRLQGLVIDLEEEEELDIPMVALRVQQALDVEKVAKRFYDHFKKELETFQGLVEGIDNQSDREWYASLMLNRMMFIYFIQKQDFLDTDQDYLQNRLRMVQEKSGQERFQHFYRMFLLRLFHEGLGQPESERAADLAELLGTVPYLNGGLFDVHGLEQNNPDIQIPDEAFENIFDFFDEYRWHLDERPHQADNEINPDVLGYIFEKYINQKQMGAYYTKEDITGYITQNTVIPFLFGAAREECPAAFTSVDGIWSLLRDDPDSYIYPAVGHGVTWDARKMPAQPLEREFDLPAVIAVGVDDVSERRDWNLAASEEFALPMETWREVVTRRQRHEEIRRKLASGKVQDINDLVTLNLDISQFAGDVIVQSESPELVRAFWHVLNNVSILDPTCGSGAFLFAALNILEPLYNACLEGMRGFVDDTNRSGESHPLGGLSDFREVLNEIDDTRRHPNQRYFVLKSIMLNNLYGVDIMEEAVEICKLRLFLKLVAQSSDYRQIEPLPDIDFNIRAGNTLVGFTSLDSVRQAMTVIPTEQHRMLSAEDSLRQVGEDAQAAAWICQQFRESQSRLDVNTGDFKTGKELLQENLLNLRDQLDRYLAAENRIDLNNPDAYVQWRASHQPFHWFVEFYNIMHEGGFDVVIGNPPFVGYSKAQSEYTVRNYTTLSSGNLYAYVVERSLCVLQHDGGIGMTVPLSVTFSHRHAELRRLLLNSLVTFWLSNYDNIPDRLFTGTKESSNTSQANQQRITILLGCRSGQQSKVKIAPLVRWRTAERALLFENIRFCDVSDMASTREFPKVGSDSLKTFLARCLTTETTVHNVLAPQGRYPLIVPKTAGYYIAAYPEELHRTKQSVLRFANRHDQLHAMVALNSNVFFWLWRVLGDGFDVTMDVVSRCPVPKTIDTEGIEVAEAMLRALQECTVYKKYRGVSVPNINFNKRMDLVFQADEWLIRKIAPNLDVSPRDFLWSKSNSILHLDIPGAESWLSAASE